MKNTTKLQSDNLGKWLLDSIETQDGLANKLISMGADINCNRHSYKKTPLIIALEIQSPDYETAELLIKRGANVNATDLDGHSPLWFCCRHKFFNDYIAQLLIEHGADINQKNRDKEPILSMAVKKKNIHAINFLIRNSADINAQNFYGETALSIALPDIELAKLLIENGSNVDAQNTQGDTALHLAAENDNYDFAEYLLEHKANPNIQNCKGETPLNKAICSSSCKIVNLLLKNGGIIGAIDE